MLRHLRSLLDGHGSNEEAVRTAIREGGGIEESTFSATLGAPRVERTNSYFSKPKIVIPIKDAPYGSAGTLVFDVPRGERDSDAQFWNLLEAFGLGLADLSVLEGEEVPIEYSGGNIVVMWDRISSDQGE